MHLWMLLWQLLCTACWGGCEPGSSGRLPERRPRGRRPAEDRGHWLWQALGGLSLRPVPAVCRLPAVSLAPDVPLVRAALPDCAPPGIGGRFRR